MSTQGAKNLVTPFRLGTLSLRNRIVMSPMTRHQSVEGIPNGADYYSSRAKGGAGLIITEGVAIDHDVADYMTDCPHNSTAEHQAAWKRVTAEVHAAGGSIVMQLWHTGIRRPVELSRRPDLPSISPSGVYPGEWPYCVEPISENEIGDIIEAYARLAKRAMIAGFDGVEVHAGHGYLLDQFF